MTEAEKKVLLYDAMNDPGKAEEILKVVNQARNVHAFNGFVNLKYVQMGQDMMVLDPTNKMNPLLNKKGAFDKYGNIEYYKWRIVKGDARLFIERAIGVWLYHTNRYDGIEFSPSNTANPRYYNSWQGWPIQPKPLNCDLYLDHIKRNICQGNQSAFDFVLDWMAQIIQEPERKTGIVLAIKGKQGCGKSEFVEHYSKLFGGTDLYYYYENSSQFLDTHFNSQLMGKLLVNLDEAIWAPDRRAWARLKSMITSDKMPITYKGKDTIQMRQYLRFIITTNEDHAAPKELNDRRYYILECADNNLKDVTFFENIKIQMKTGGYEGLMQFLLARDISNRNWQNLPKTLAQIHDIRESAPWSIRYLIDSVQGDLLEDESAFLGEKIVHENQRIDLDVGVFMAKLKKYCNRLGNGFPPSTNAVTKEYKKYLNQPGDEIFRRIPVTIAGQTRAFYQFTKMSNLKARIAQILGIMPDYKITPPQVVSEIVASDN
jgi:hypothetical protein